MNGLYWAWGPWTGFLKVWNSWKIIMVCWSSKRPTDYGALSVEGDKGSYWPQWKVIWLLNFKITKIWRMITKCVLLLGQYKPSSPSSIDLHVKAHLEGRCSLIILKYPHKSFFTSLITNESFITFHVGNWINQLSEQQHLKWSQAR